MALFLAVSSVTIFCLLLRIVGLKKEIESYKNINGIIMDGNEALKARFRETLNELEELKKK